MTKTKSIISDDMFMSKREQIAAMALQGILSKPSLVITPERYANQAVRAADALIKELEDKND